MSNFHQVAGFPGSHHILVNTFLAYLVILMKNSPIASSGSGIYEG